MVRRSVVVTGASTGIGRASVDAFARLGYHVWATVRTDADEQALRRDHPTGVDVLRMDLTDEASVRAAGERVAAAGPLHGLVNNAGVALPGPLEFVPIAVFRRQIEVNLTGQLLVTQVMLPALRAAREAGDSARIVMIGSIGGRAAGPMLGPYHASKFGLAGLSGSLRAELAPWGIPVILLEPGPVATPIWDRGATAADDLLPDLPPAAARYAGQIRKVRADARRSAARGIPAARAAKVVVAAVTGTSTRPRRVLGPSATVSAVLLRILPQRLLYRMLAARPDSTEPAMPDRSST